MYRKPYTTAYLSMIQRFHRFEIQRQTEPNVALSFFRALECPLDTHLRTHMMQKGSIIMFRKQLMSIALLECE
jgi:hypothetical protein